MTATENRTHTVAGVIRLIPGAVRHLRRGTLLQALRRRFAPRPPAPARHGLTRYNARTPSDVAQVLPPLARAALASRSGTVLVVGPPAPLREQVLAALATDGVTARAFTPVEFERLAAAEFAGVGCVVLTTLDSREQFALADRLTRNPHTSEIPLEYVALPHDENAAMAGWDRYQDADFVSPLLAQHGQAFYDIYRESLTRFRQKTDIRDYLDLCVLLRSLTQRGLPGNVAEFGSFRGHSGYLISRLLERLGSTARLYMFDMFENFPEESAGVDRFWSGTHKVDFEAVRAKFQDRPNVQLVKGDFTQTLPLTDTGPLAFAFVDCDSFRATQFLLEYLWDGRLVAGGIVVMEDYGHAALLGNRLAVHQFFDGRADAFTYFSQFSGFFIAVKVPAPVR